MTPAAAVPDSLLDALVERIADRLVERIAERIARQADATEPVWQPLELASERLCVTPATVRGYIAAGRLPAEQRGRRWWVRSDAVVAPLAAPAAIDSPATRARAVVATARRRGGAR